ncbi:MAG: sugar transferase [Planctomycetota bacterium]
MKRTFDTFCSGIGLMMLVPLLALVFLSIRLLDGTPALFRQERVGKNGERFTILKFRTMALPEVRPSTGLTVGNDLRITNLGRWLRKLKIDELPQLWNVLRGEMSLVGPRPEIPKYADHYPQDLSKVLDYRPGITDPASLHFRNESELLNGHADPERFYVEKLLPAKLRISLSYAERATVWTDIGVVIQSVACFAPCAFALLPPSATTRTAALSPASREG